VELGGSGQQVSILQSSSYQHQTLLVYERRKAGTGFFGMTGVPFAAEQKAQLSKCAAADSLSATQFQQIRAPQQ